MALERQGGHASQVAAAGSVAARIGGSGETVRNWMRQAARGQGLRGGTASEERGRTRASGRESRALRQANESLRQASA